MIKQIRAIVEQITKPMRDRIFMLIARGVIDAVNDTGGVQSVKMSLLADEVRDDLERFQNYGFTSTPFAGAEGVAIFPGGNREHGLIVAVDDRRARPKDIPPGGSAQYGGPEGAAPTALVKTLADGTVHLESVATGCVIEITPAGEITLGGAVEYAAIASKAEARIAALEAQWAAHEIFFAAHVHVPTAPPTVPIVPFVPDTSVIASSKVKVSL